VNCIGRVGGVQVYSCLDAVSSWPIYCLGTKCSFIEAFQEGREAAVDCIFRGPRKLCVSGKWTRINELGCVVLMNYALYNALSFDSREHVVS
jgi:hypothetical protein